MADVVYVVRPGDRNEELRYSLRSLQNLLPQPSQVVIAGYKPEWVQNVLYLPVPRHWDKHRSSTQNLREACLSEAVSDPFWFWNDDQFAMQPHTLEVHHRGPVADTLRYYRNAYVNGSLYIRGMQRTADLLEQDGYEFPLCYDAIHVPLLVHKGPMLETIRRGSGIRAFHKMTYYGNLSAIGGTYHDDVKVRPGVLRDFRNSPLLSTSDEVFGTHEVGTYIRESFPSASVYEKESVYRTRSKDLVRYRDG